MKLLFSRLLYYIGDLISKIFYYNFARKLSAILYPIYSKIMILSSNLDKEGKVWQDVNNDKQD